MKARFLRSVRGKLYAILALTTVLALAVASVSLLAVHLVRELAATEQDVVTQADVLALASAPALAFGDERAASESLAILQARPTVRAAALYDAAGRLMASWTAGEDAPQVPPVPEAQGVRVDSDMAVAWRPVSLRGERVGTLWLQLRHDRLRQALQYVAVLVLTMAGSLAAALALTNRLQRNLVAPILDVAAVARRILSGDTAQLRAARTSDDEVGDLVDAFNAMLDELGRRARTLESANEALRTSEARYQLAVRGSSAGLWDWDMRAGTMFHAPRLKAMLGYVEAQFPDLPTSLGRVLHPDDRPRLRAALRAHLRHRVPYQVECRLRDEAGQWRWFFIAGEALRDAQGRPYRMAGSMVEVTERKQAEQVLQDSNRAKDEFLATLAHELRNPLAPIRTGLEILRRDPAGPVAQRARATMERQLAHMVRLVDDLLDISRITSGKIRVEPRQLDLREVLETALEAARPALSAAGHALSVELAPGVRVDGDPTRLAQAVGNLLNNAARYTPPGGHVALRLRAEGGDAVVEVEDDGEGIPADMLERVFQLFTQVRAQPPGTQGGLGIGLYLVRSLVALHGGSVAARSPGPGRGSMFTVRLPLATMPAAPVPAPAPPVPQGALAGLRVLVVDDNVDAAETLASALALDGCTTRCVHDGGAALPAALDFAPDVVLLDIGLPGMDGYQVARMLRAHPALRGILLAALTGWGSAQDRQRAREAGFDHHLTKPVELGALQALLRSRVRAGR